MFQPARRALCALAIALVGGLAASVGAAPAQAQVPYTARLFAESRYAAIVVDANTGEVLYSRNADARRYPASITKLMTLYLVFEQLQSGRLSLDDSVVVSAHAASMSPSKLGLRPGEAIPVDAAIRAVAIKSANDIAAALAEKIGGSESRFAALMTLRAQELGMSNTNYANASGLPDTRQVSSARDIAILSRALMRDFPQYYSYFGQRQFTYRGQTIKTHNHLLESMPGVDGLKTGYINASGFNLAASATRNGRRLIAVVMGGSSVATRDTHVEDLLETGFSVMARRDRGEVIQVAQNLFEPAPDGPITRPLTAQGDEDQRGLQIVVDQNLPSSVSPYSPTNTYRIVPRSAQTYTQIPAPRGMQVAEAQPYKPTPVREKAPAKPEPKVTKAAAVATCDEPAPAKGKKAAAKTRGAKAAKGKGCATDGSTTVADKDSKKKGKDGKASKLAIKEEEPEGEWIVQVGAFKDKASAKSHLAKVSKSSNKLADAKSSVAGGDKGMYRARFSGLSKADARSACASLKAKGLSCMAINAG